MLLSQFILHSNSSGDYALSQNKIIKCALNKNISTINYNQFVANICNMTQVYNSDDTIHDLKVIITIIDATNTIRHKIELEIAIHVVIGEA